MTATIYTFDGATALDISADKILENAMDKLDGAVVIGYTKDGDLHFASSYANASNTVMLLELAKRRLLEHFD